MDRENKSSGQKEKVLNKELEEISHFFLSGSAPRAPQKKEGFNPFEETVRPEIKKRVLPFLSFCSNIPSAFFTCNIGLDLARQGKEVFIIDVEKRQPNVESTFGLKPASLGLTDILYPSEGKIFRNVDVNLRVLDLRLELSSLPSSQRERDKKLLELLSREESLSEWMLINLPKSGFALQNTDWVVRIKEIILFTDGLAQNLIETYAFIKTLSSFKPDIAIYLGICDISTIDEAKEVFEKMLRGVALYLNRTIGSLGYLLKDPAISQSIVEQFPIMKTGHLLIPKELRTMTRVLMESKIQAANFFSFANNMKEF
jgi:MinD-like ATPase involved in chromosome partitioning or flagellar assembly